MPRGISYGYGSDYEYSSSDDDKEDDENLEKAKNIYTCVEKLKREVDCTTQEAISLLLIVEISKLNDKI